MSQQMSTPEGLEEIAKRFANWLATPEGVQALGDVLERISKTASDLQLERELDAQALERPVTL